MRVNFEQTGKEKMNDDVVSLKEEIIELQNRVDGKFKTMMHFIMCLFNQLRKGETMNFNEMLAAIEKGQYARRQDWQDGYVVLLPDMAYILRVITKSVDGRINVGNYLPTTADLLADDWLLFAPGVKTVNSPVFEGVADAA